MTDPCRTLVVDRSGAIPIILLEAGSYPAWLERNPDRRSWLQSSGFDCKPGSFALLPNGAGAVESVLAVPHASEQVWRLADLPSVLPPGRYAIAEDGDNVSDQTRLALGWALGSYDFTAYRRAKREPAELVWPQAADKGEVVRVARGICLARDLINTPAEDMGPAELAEAAVQVAVRSGAVHQVIEGDALLDQGYPAIHTVGRASRRAPRLIDLRWGEEDAPKVTLVGKGVCFDTGGLDLKPREGMLEMKKDMGGAAVVLGLADILMSARAPIRLRVLVPAVENAVSGNAMRPLDIIRTRAGKTVEVGNTDAEGRLILCDALAEADGEAPELLVDCATLTGASRIALGSDIQALFCDDDEAAADLVSRSLEIGDPVWRLPLWRGYRQQLDGRCAELNNVAKKQVGQAIIAALFLAEFVEQSGTWMHLDINASNDSARPGRPEGGEATGLLALHAFIAARYGRETARALH